ncbi:MAG: cyclic nucleotide-binding domain-containing protein [Actinomycetota bacterium]
MASDPKEERLRALQLFEKADRRAMSHLISAIDEADVKAGQNIITQGRDGQEIYIVAEGTAAAIIDGNEVAEIPAGELVGELGYFVRRPASATITAKTDLKVLVMPYNRFDQILDDNPHLVRLILEEVAQRLYDTDAKLN